MAVASARASVLAGATGQAEARDAGLGPNLLRNADLEHGMSPWILERTLPAAGSATLLATGDAPVGASGRPIRFQVSALGAQNWHVQFYQRALALADGQPYTLTFWARSSANRTIAVHANVDSGDGHGIGLAADRIPLTSQWRRVALLFTAERTVAGHNRLTFLLGDALGTADLAGISLRAGRSVQPAGPSILANGDFADGSGHWALESGPAPAEATLEFAEGAPPGVSGKVAHFEVKALGSQPWHVQFAQAGLDLADGEPYTLSFWARASTARPVSVVTSLDRPDWHNVGVDSRQVLSESWKQHTIDFTALRTSPHESRLAFVLGDALGSVDLAGISLRHDTAPSAGQPGSAPTPAPAGPENLHDVAVPVTLRGAPVSDVTVTLRYRGAVGGTVRLGAADNGIATFANVPAGIPLLLTVECGEQTAEFRRVARTGNLPPIMLPAYWTDVKTVAPAPAPGRQTAAPTLASSPLVGTWQARRDGGGQTYQFVFGADGAGSIRSVDTGRADPKLRSPAETVFRWSLSADSRRVVIGDRSYVWVITLSGPNKKLVLTDANGKSHTLYRR